MANMSDELKARTKKFALRIIKVSRALPRSPEARVIGYQLLRSGTSVAANYRAACRGRSRPEFLAKIGIVVEEADETDVTELSQLPLAFPAKRQTNWLLFSPLPSSR